MLEEIYPRDHSRFSALPVLGPHLDGFVAWLRECGFPVLSIQLRLRAARRLDAMLWRKGIRHPTDLSAAGLLAYRPQSSLDDVYLSAVVRSLVTFFEEQDLLAPPPRATAVDDILSSYCRFLEDERGLAVATVHFHLATAREFLDYVRHEACPDCLRELGISELDGFVELVSRRLARSSLQQLISCLRSFLRFLATKGMASAGLDAKIEIPRVYQDERLPRALPWKTVLSLLGALDRSTLMGKRDYAMFLLIATYGLRGSEVAALTLDDIDWRNDLLSVFRPKVDAPLLLPMTRMVGEAIIEYLQDGRRPDLPDRHVFLRVLAPIGALLRGGVSTAFVTMVRASGLDIPFKGAHCLRHSLAAHLLRQGTPLKTIGDLLGHSCVASTSVYLRLNVEELREVALDLPQEVQR